MKKCTSAFHVNTVVPPETVPSRPLLFRLTALGIQKLIMRKGQNFWSRNSQSDLDIVLSSTEITVRKIKVVIVDNKQKNEGRYYITLKLIQTKYVKFIKNL